MALEVHVVTPEREIWKGEAHTVVARGTEGEVGILAGHAPMLIRLAIGAVRVLHDDTEEVLVADGGFLHVTSEEGATRVDILATDAVRRRDIDLHREGRRKEEMERRLADRDDLEARAELSKALARIRVAG